MIRSFIIVLLSFPIQVFGQAEFGIKAGLNVSDIVMTNYINPDVESDLRLKPGIQGGFFIIGTLTERVGMAAELLYVNKGVRANGNINLHYINVPLLVEYRLSDMVFGEIGPELGYMVSATSDYGNAASTYHNKFDVGLDGGFRLATRKINFGLRYCVGMFSVREPIQFNSSSGVEKIKYQNRSLQLSVGYKFTDSRTNVRSGAGQISSVSRRRFKRPTPPRKNINPRIARAQG